MSDTTTSLEDHLATLMRSGALLQHRTRFKLLGGSFHNHLSLAIVQNTDDDAVYVVWCDGPRAEAEQLTGVKAGMAVLAQHVESELKSDYFG